MWPHGFGFLVSMTDGSVRNAYQKAGGREMKGESKEEGEREGKEHG